MGSRGEGDFLHWFFTYTVNTESYFFDIPGGLGTVVVLLVAFERHVRALALAHRFGPLERLQAGGADAVDPPEQEPPGRGTFVRADQMSIEPGTTRVLSDERNDVW